MNEETKNKEPKNEEVRKITSADYKSGTLKLSSPILARDQEIRELRYDFAKLTGRDYVEAMDSDRNSKDIFKVSATQAFTLFAISAGKETEDVDAVDIQKQLSMTDTARAVQTATLFLIMSVREANAIT